MNKQQPEHLRENISLTYPFTIIIFPDLLLSADVTEICFALKCSCTQTIVETRLSENNIQPLPLSGREGPILV